MSKKSHATTKGRLFTLVIIGDTAAGKSSVLLRMNKDKFLENHVSTIGFDCFVQEVQKKNILYTFKIWDTAGQERFTSLGTKYFKSANGIIFVYDVTDRNSFLNIRKWAGIVEKATKRDLTCYLLLGNKCDLEDKKVVTPEEGEELAKELEMKFYETSAKTGENIDSSFNYLFNQVIKVFKDIKDESFQIKKTEDEEEHNDCCEKKK